MAVAVCRCICQTPFRACMVTTLSHDFIGVLITTLLVGTGRPLSSIDVVASPAAELVAMVPGDVSILNAANSSPNSRSTTGVEPSRESISPCSLFNPFYIWSTSNLVGF